MYLGGDSFEDPWCLNCKGLGSGLWVMLPSLHSGLAGRGLGVREQNSWKKEEEKEEDVLAKHISCSRS